MLCSPDGKVAPRPRRRNARRGATAMEYLFVISLILVVAISGIGYFGQAVKNTTKNSADAINQATKK
jgi:Flp pilus assembly pilin Flp